MKCGFVIQVHSYPSILGLEGTLRSSSQCPCSANEETDAHLGVTCLGQNQHLGTINDDVFILWEEKLNKTRQDSALALPF